MSILGTRVLRTEDPAGIRADGDELAIGAAACHADVAGAEPGEDIHADVAGAEPGEDIHADRTHRQHLARVLARRALEHQTG